MEQLVDIDDLEWIETGSDAPSSTSTDYGALTRHVHVRIEPARAWRRLGVYPDMVAAMIEKDACDPGIHTYQTRYDSLGRRGTTYRCRSHSCCRHELKIVFDRLLGTYALLESGTHAGAQIQRERQGISPLIMAQINTMLVAGLRPLKARTLLQVQYARDDAMRAVIPEVSQISNHKAYLVRTRAGGWEMKTFGTLMEWASGKKCTTRDAFMVAQPSFEESNQLIVLDCFQHTFDDSETGEKRASFGIIFSSRTCFSNLAAAVEAQGDDLVVSTDGTYRIHFGGWTLVDCGTVAVARSDNGDYVHRFIPFVYMFVRSECTYAYKRMFQAIVRYADIFFGVKVQVKLGSIDHSDAIATAFHRVWPEVTIVTCWPHVVRKSRAEIGRLKNRAFYEGTVLKDIRMLHRARSHKQFEALAEVVLQAWRDSDEDEYASWFDVTYLSPRWNRWHVTASEVPGVLPSQQPIESHHAVIKAIASDNKRAPTAVVLNDVMPKVLFYDGANLASEHPGHFTVGPLIADAIAKAKALHLEKLNFKRIAVRATGLVYAYVFNSRATSVGLGNVNAKAVSDTRSNQFLGSLKGVLPRELRVDQIRNGVLSLHIVEVDGSLVSELPPFEVKPLWYADDIATVRSLFRCSCKTYYKTGWMCSHVIATMHHMGKLDINLASERIPVRRGPGAPRKNRGALTEEEDDDFYSTANLEDLFVRRPG